MKHITRHFILAADSIGVFEGEDILYKTIHPYMPDATDQVAVSCPPDLPSMTLSMIRRSYGVNPFILSCQLCFAKQFSDQKLQSVLDLPYKRLYEPILKWISYVGADGQQEDSCPPLLFSLLEELIQGQQDALAEEGAHGDVADF